VSVASDGSAHIDRGEAIEIIKNVPRGIEQSWWFGQKPKGSGELIVRIRVSGQEYAAMTSTGLHFFDPATGIGFRYGIATWVDAGGARYALNVVFEGGEIVIRVPETVVQSSDYPALLDPVVSAQYDFDLPVNGPAVALQANPALAYSPTASLYLAVWSDYRREGDFVSDIRAARMTATGVILDTVGFHVPSTNVPGDQLEPRVAWVSSLDPHWVVVWTDASFLLNMTTQVRGIRLRPDGSQVAPDFDISDKDDEFSESEPDVAHNAAESMIGISYRRVGQVNTIRVRRCAVGAGCGELAEVDVTAQPSARTAAIAAGEAAGFVVVWTDARNGNPDVFARRVGANLSLGPELAVATSGADQLNPAIAYAPGNGWIAVWEDGAIGSKDIHGAKIANSGESLTGSNFVVSAAANGQTSPAIAGATNNPHKNKWFVTWSDARNGGINDIYGARLQWSSNTVSVLDPGGIAVSTAQGLQVEPAVAYNPQNSNFMSVWSDARSASEARDIYGARVAVNNGNVLDPGGILVSRSANQQAAPAMAACGGKYLVVWTDTRNDYQWPDIYGAITDASFPPAILVSNIAISTAAGRQDLPRVACNGSDFFVVWADERNGNRDIYGARVRASDGVVLDPSGIPITTHAAQQNDPAVSYHPSGILQVVWADDRSGNYDIYGKRVSTAGVVDHGSELNITGAVPGNQIRPDLSWYRDAQFAEIPRFLVVWQDGRSGGEFPVWEVYGRYVNTIGQLFSTLAIATGGPDRTQPVVATRPNTAFLNSAQLVVYEQAVAVGGGWSHDVRATAVTPSGVGSTIAVAANVNQDEVQPRVANRSGASFVVTYRTGHNSERFNFDIYGQDVTFSPLGLSGPAFAIANANHNRERTPAVSCASASSCQSAHRTYLESPPPHPTPQPPFYGADRVHGAMLSY
jgi:hypothetical protein